jgi:predicted anti-sigma-YlaC factor YlaD
MLSLSGHIGTKASALVDGQLSQDDEERAWSHVLACPGCRQLVEREGWTKRQLGSLSGPAPVAPPERLLGTLYDVETRVAWDQVEDIERRSVRRRTVAVVVGGSAVGACALALLTVTGPPVGRGETPTRQAPASVGGTARTSGGSVGGGVNAPGSNVVPFRTETSRSPEWVRRSR